jgi:CRISPR-associated endonuclease/helicase Cas3
MTFDELFVAATGKPSPYPWQRDLAVRSEPAAVISAPTGAGKTEAVLLDWLWRRLFHPDPEERRRTPRRLVYALPMRVLVEQTLARVRDALDSLWRKHILERPVRAYPLMGGRADDSWVLEPENEAVLVGTTDMLLSRALNRGFGRGRPSWPLDFGLVNNDCLWVFDEVQLMDAAVATSCQLEAFRRRFGTVGPARTVWMSATLDLTWLGTKDHEAPTETLVAQVSAADRAGPLGRRLQAPKMLIREAADPTDARTVARLVLREHGALADVPDAPRLTVAIANTVERAVELYKELKRHLAPNVDLLLLHSRFRPADRESRVARLQETPPSGGRIIVSTQVIEAGVDLDAGALITEVAPWASMVQRAGRLNRTGGRTNSPGRLVWLDPGEDRLERLHRPYELHVLRPTRSELLQLDGAPFSPDHIADFMNSDRIRRSQLLGSRPVTLFLRAPDLVDLFDTDPTLDGDDPDVGRFIRIGEDLDVGVAWRDFSADEGPPEHDPLPTLDEVCPVPVWERGKLAELRPWRWSYARRRWERVTSADDIVVGDLLLLSSDGGGYDTDLGWTGKREGRVAPVTVAASAAPGDTDADDPDSLRPGRWISLNEHTRDVLKELREILARVELDGEWAQALELAALAHDTGKAHPEFQGRLRRWAGEDPPDKAIYAKAPDKVRWRPPFAFRHELVSALLLLERGGRSRDLDLAAYLVAAHHGKLRMTPRLLPDDQDPERVLCFGVCEGDEVPEVILDGERFGPLRVDLSLMRIGDLKETTWIERVLDLRDRLGVFRLAYLEALLRAADQRASEKERCE